MYSIVYDSLVFRQGLCNTHTQAFNRWVFSAAHKMTTPTNTKSGRTQTSSLYSTSGPLWFSPIWPHKEGNDRLMIHRWRQGERVHDWLCTQILIPSQSLWTERQSVLRSRENKMRKSTPVMSER
jgi:hypothetical protein